MNLRSRSCSKNMPSTISRQILTQLSLIQRKHHFTKSGRPRSPGQCVLEEYAKYYYLANFDTAITDKDITSLYNRTIAKSGRPRSPGRCVLEEYAKCYYYARSETRSASAEKLSP